MVAGSRCFPLCVCLLENLDNSKQEMHRTTYMLGISVPIAWCFPLLLTWTLLHICPERWDDGVPPSAPWGSYSPECALFVDTVCAVSLHSCDYLWPKATEGGEHKKPQQKAPSPIRHSLGEGSSERRQSIHPCWVFLSLDLPLKGRAVSWWLGQNQCRTRRLESIYI